jgi:hypothetical protein
VIVTNVTTDAQWRYENVVDCQIVGLTVSPTGRWLACATVNYFCVLDLQHDARAIPRFHWPLSRSPYDSRAVSAHHRHPHEVAVQFFPVMTFSDDEQYLLIDNAPSFNPKEFDWQGQVQLVSMESGAVLWGVEIGSPFYRVTCAVIDREENRVLVGLGDPTYLDRNGIQNIRYGAVWKVTILNLSTGALLGSLADDPWYSITAMARVGPGRLAVATSDGLLRIVDVRHRSVLCGMWFEDKIIGIARETAHSLLFVDDGSSGDLQARLCEVEVVER